ncbi:thymidine phosphorylase [Clostridiales bacterium PH28_bin88]|nr:thymidine phosphorylase [Clostridiales bacterium PH28_bin88]
MRAYDIIWKKRNGGILSREEIEFFVRGYTAGGIPDYQAAALAMAIYFRGLEARETADLTMAMVYSGDRVDLGGIRGIKVDKHSTGGVGDTTTLVLVPLVAAAGAPVAKMSGRGLGHTGGTVDKLESIPGFKVSLEPMEFVEAVNRVGAAVVGQTGNMVPADKKLYALRDVTATIESVPLIASSVMSKKIAAGADAIVLDVKVGSGAFMKTPEAAFELARAMVDIGTMVGRRTVAVVTQMDQPLGYAVGNALEVREAIDTLKGEGPADLHELCLLLGAHMLQLAGVVADVQSGTERLQQVIAEGLAVAKFKEMIVSQSGDPAVVDRPELLPRASFTREVKAEQDGFVRSIDAQEVGLAAMMLGAGRETKEDHIDMSAGVVVGKKVGDRVQPGETLVTLHANRQEKLAEAEQRIRSAYRVGAERPSPPPLVYGVVTAEGVRRF